MEVSTQIKGILNGAFAYIYIWYSKQGRCIYVGQTNEKHGVLGRARSHIGSTGTLRLRVHEKKGASIEEYDDWNLLSYRLPAQKNYTSIESSHRLAVEYLIQVKLLEIRGDLNPPLQIISNVTYSDYCSQPRIIRLAEEIIEEFKSSYRSKK